MPARVTVMVPASSVTLVLLSRATQPAVLINTNAWYWCEDGIQTLVNEGFAHRKLCDPPTYIHIIEECEMHSYPPVTTTGRVLGQGEWIPYPGVS